MHTVDLIATAAFGLESVVAREVKQLGYEVTAVEDGRVCFSGPPVAVARANVWLRSADRVLVRVGAFEAHDFGELFDRVRDLSWLDWLNADAAFPVRGRAVRSTLMSVRDCQAIAKKAIVEKLRSAYGGEWLAESGPTYQVDFSILKDRVTIALDSSGAGLHKRGYRSLGGAAPLRETLAAALVQLSYWDAERPFVDPFCGSGTIPIEAAMIGRRLAPGATRSFAAESWPQLGADLWRLAREEARDCAVAAPAFPLIGTDVDEGALDHARHHAQRAGVAGDVHFQRADVGALKSKRKYGCVITNPPYGERLGDRREAEVLYGCLASAMEPLDTWSVYVLAAHPRFEEVFGRRATRRRKLYNGRIECTYYQYAGPRPPRRRPAEEAV
jgi:putative N6-adenine-specific DNA methylase